MKISHVTQSHTFSQEVSEDVGLLLTNKSGGFFNLGIPSKYRGLTFFLQDTLYKILDDIHIDGKITEIIHSLSSVKRKRDDNEETFTLYPDNNTFRYDCVNSTTISLFFDVKKPYDNRDWGRNYLVYTEGNRVVIQFTKKTDSREDTSHNEKEYELFIVIDPLDGSLIECDKWSEQHYSFDEKRNSYPYSRHTYNPIKIKGSSFILGCGLSKEEAHEACNTQHQSSQQAGIEASSTLQLAQSHAQHALKQLVVYRPQPNIYAGLPWFFQFWGRDTLIALKGLILTKQYQEVKHILLEYFSHIQEDGLIPNILPKSEINSADAVGWFFTRMDEFFSQLESEGVLNDYFSSEEKDYLIKKLELCVNALFKNYTQAGFAINNKQETWMDTTHKGDDRSGVRIEIQGLRIRIYQFIYRLTGKKIYQDMHLRLAKKVKDHLWNGSYLSDGLTDPTIRPNVFIFAYLYRDLLSEQEWIICFDTLLKKLWLSWGGLSSIATDHPLYCAYNTGDKVDSYHRGDSWFWVNNLCALVLAKTNYEHFKPYIQSIVKASMHDLLFKGFIGTSSEISDAATQSAKGCLNQAWSNSLLLELIDELIKQGRHEDFK